MSGLPAGSLTKRIRIERPIADHALDGAGSGDWQLVATVRASVDDNLPSRGERLAGGVNVAARPARGAAIKAAAAAPKTAAAKPAASPRRRPAP